MRMIRYLMVGAVIYLVCQPAYARILHVPDEYPTIAEGIEASVNGDTVLVAPGEYVESFTFGGKNILLTSSHGPDTTLIRGEIRFENREDSTCIIRGFSLTNTGFFHSIRCRSSTSPIVEGNKIIDHWGDSGIFIINGDTSSGCTIRNNMIMNNHDWVYGPGGIYIEGIGVKIMYNIIKGNISSGEEGLGGGIYLRGNAYIGYNLFIDNKAIRGTQDSFGEGGGIFRIAFEAIAGITYIVNNTFVNNLAWNPEGSGGGALFNFTHNWNDSLIIKNNIFAYNEASLEYASGAYIVLADSSYCYWDYNCIYENTICGVEPGAHDIFTDPLFVDTLNDDFHLLPQSPCIDAGDPDSPLDPDSTRADIGAFFYDQSVDIETPGEPSGTYKFKLHQNYPNPFNAQTIISYYLPKSDIVTLSVYSITGQLVARLVSEECQDAGEHEIIWDGCDINGNSVATGIYFYQLKIGGYKEAKALIIIR